MLAACAPLLAALGTSIWLTPYPVNETVAVLEDVQRTTGSFFDPTLRSWYRPLYFATWYWFWNGSGSLDVALALFKGLQVAAPLALAVLLIWQLRPRSLLEAAVAWCAVAVLIGSPGFRDNLEVPLLMTLVAMPPTLAVWMLLTRPARGWSGLAILLLTIVALGYKEQGLVIAPVVVVAWWTRAPGASSWVTAAHVAVTLAYLAFRLAFSGNWPVFEQSMGLWFRIIEPSEALARFGAFPYWMYAYNVLGTILNVLVGEPSAGLFAIARDVAHSRLQPWEVVYLVGAISLTGTIVWWIRRVCPGLGRDGWTPEGRVAIAFVASLLASGVLSYHYSRDRLGGMAAIFYALAAYEALRHVAARAAEGSGAAGRRFALTGAFLAVLALTWHVRAVGTLEWTRRMSETNTRGWLTQLAPRREEFAGRHTYLAIMNHMSRQGTSPDAVRPTNYPDVVQRTLAAPVPQQ